MRLLVYSALVGVLSLSHAIGQDGEVAALEEAYSKVEQAYLEDLYQAQKPLLEKRLKKLKDWKARATSKKQEALVKEIDREIEAVKTEIAKAVKALKGVKNPPPPRPKVPTRAEPDKPKTIAVDFAEAELEGGLVYDSNTKSLAGWKSRKDKATIRINIREGVMYDIELAYRSTDKGRIKVSLDHLSFLPDLKDTSDSEKSVTADLGEFRSEKATATLTLGLPLHRSKEFVQVRGLRLVPQK